MTEEQIKALQDKLAQQIKDGNKVDHEAFDEMKKAYDELKVSTDALIEAQKGISVPGVDADKFSFGKCLEHVKSGASMASVGGYEGEVIQATMKEQTVSPSTAGGVFVPTEISSSIVELAVAKTVLDTLKIQRITLQGNNRLTIPTVTADASCSWIGELAEIPASAMTFGSVEIEPWKLAAFVIMSNEILSQGNANMEAMVRNSMVKQLALGLDYAGLMGTGSGDKKPLGILNTPNIISVDAGGTNGDVASWATYDSLQAGLESANTLEGTLAYVTRPEINRALRNQTIANYSGQTDGTPLFAVPFMSQAQLESTVGMPLKATTQFDITAKGTSDTAPIIFGDFSQMLLATWGNIEIASDSSLMFREYGTVMRAVMRADVKVLRPSSFAVAPTVAFRDTAV